MYLLQMYLCVFVNCFAAFHDLVNHHFRGPSTEWKEHWAVAVSFSGFFKYFTHASAQILFCQSAGQGFCLVSLIIRCGVISEVHAGDGFQFWNIIDFHTLPCVNAKFYKFRNDSFDLSTGMHIKEYAQFVATVNGFLDLWFDQGTPYIRGEEFDK